MESHHLSLVLRIPNADIIKMAAHSCKMLTLLILHCSKLSNNTYLWMHRNVVFICMFSSCRTSTSFKQTLSSCPFSFCSRTRRIRRCQRARTQRPPSSTCCANQVRKSNMLLSSCYFICILKSITFSILFLRDYRLSSDPSFPNFF